MELNIRLINKVTICGDDLGHSKNPRFIFTAKLSDDMEVLTINNLECFPNAQEYVADAIRLLSKKQLLADTVDSLEALFGLTTIHIDLKKLKKIQYGTTQTWFANESTFVIDQRKGVLTISVMPAEIALREQLLEVWGVVQKWDSNGSHMTQSLIKELKSVLQRK